MSSDEREREIVELELNLYRWYASCTYAEHTLATIRKQAEGRIVAAARMGKVARDEDFDLIEFIHTRDELKNRTVNEEVERAQAERLEQDDE